MIAIYDDGQRDVPIESTLTFWVMPWKFILALVLVVLLIILGLASFFRKSFKVVSGRSKK